MKYFLKGCSKDYHQKYIDHRNIYIFLIISQMGSRKDPNFTKKLLILHLRKESKNFKQIAGISFFYFNNSFILIKISWKFQNQLLQKYISTFTRLGISNPQKQQAAHLLSQQEGNNFWRILQLGIIFFCQKNC